MKGLPPHGVRSSTKNSSGDEQRLTLRVLLNLLDNVSITLEGLKAVAAHHDLSVDTLTTLRRQGSVHWRLIIRQSCSLIARIISFALDTCEDIVSSTQLAARRTFPVPQDVVRNSVTLDSITLTSIRNRTS